MAKQLIKEAYRMQQLAGLINENYVDLGPINSPFNESEEVNEADAGMKAIEDKIKSGKIDPKEVEAAAKKATSGDTTELAQLMVQAMGMKFEGEEEDGDIEDGESDQEEYDFNAPGKKDEFDTDDDVEPTAKDVKGGDALAKTAGGKQAKLDALIKQKDTILNKLKSGQITIDQYKAEIGNIPMQIKQLQADIDRDLSVDDENEY